jgi:hypothetical protein
MFPRLNLRIVKKFTCDSVFLECVTVASHFPTSSIDIIINNSIPVQDLVRILRTEICGDYSIWSGSVLNFTQVKPIEAAVRAIEISGVSNIEFVETPPNKTCLTNAQVEANKEPFDS